VSGLLRGKIVLISGAAEGSGPAHVRACVEQGARVVIGDTTESLGTKLAIELGDHAIWVWLDVTDPWCWQAAVNEIETTFGPVTVLVNNASVPGAAIAAADLSFEDYRATVNIAQDGTYLGMRTVIPSMVVAGGGSIINVTNTGGGGALAAGTPNIAVAAAQFAVLGMTRAAAAEYAHARIRVNSVHPGRVASTLMAQDLDDTGRPAVTKHVPLGLVADPEVISGLVVFLASEEASEVSGAAFVADGGMLVR
jgi:3alpha(or 20beta)-hydroxysteroid dehydrogenase